MKKILAVLLAGACLSAGAANVYVDANIGMNTSWSAVGLNADVGYMFNKYVGLEGGFTYSPSYSYNWGGGSSWSSSYYMFDGASKVYYHYRT